MLTLRRESTQYIQLELESGVAMVHGSQPLSPQMLPSCREAVRLVPYDNNVDAQRLSPGIQRWVPPACAFAFS